MSQPAAMLLTLAVEVPLYTALFAVGLLSFRRAVLAAVMVNLLTHPLLWLALGPRPPLLAVVLAEVAVGLAEFLLVGLVVRRSPLLVGLTAVAANAGSILAGAVIAGAA